MSPEPDPSPNNDEMEELDFEIAFYEGILERLPDAADVLMALGNDYTRRGLLEKGLAIDEQLCRLRGNDPIVRYNLACTYSLLGRLDDALEALTTAVAMGYNDFSYMQQDPDLDNLRADPRYADLLERTGSRKSTT
jgi:tetratricopeptide (TPR) repeat protein